MSYTFQDQNRKIIISGWENGIAESAYVGHQNMVNIDILSQPGSALIQFAAEEVEDGLDGLMRWFVQDPIAGTIYGLDDTGDVWQSADDGDTWAILAGNTLTNANGNGLGIWVSPNSVSAFPPSPEVFLFVARDALLDVYDIGNTAWTNGWKFLWDNQFHPMLTGQDNILYIGQDALVASVEETLGSTFVPATASTYKWNPRALDIPGQYFVNAFTSQGINLLIGASGQGTDAQIFPWDRTSDSFNFPVQVFDKGINQLFTKDNVVYANTGTRCDLKTYDGSRVLLYREMKNILLDNQGITLEALPGAICSHNEELLVGIGLSSGSANDAAPLGVYSFKDGRYVLKNVISDGNYGQTDNVRIGAVYSLGDNKYLIGWESSGVYGIDKVGDTNIYYGSYQAWIDTDLIPVGNFIKKPNISRIEFKLGKPLVSGQGIKIDYRKNLTDAFTNIGTWDFATIGSRLSYIDDANINEPEWVQLRISLTTGAPNADLTPELVNVTLHMV